MALENPCVENGPLQSDVIKQMSSIYFQILDLTPIDTCLMKYLYNKLKNIAVMIHEILGKFRIITKMFF